MRGKVNTLRRKSIRDGSSLPHHCTKSTLTNLSPSAMSRDKCGAASVAGFLKTVSLLAPDHVNITAGLSFVRNSVGSDSYVSDEVILSRAGVRGG